MKKLLKRTFCLVLTLLLLTGASAYFLLYTNAGLEAALGMASRLLPGTLSASSVSGNLADSFMATRLVYTGNGLEVEVSALECSWSVWELIAKRLHFHSIEIRGVRIKSNSSQAYSPDHGKSSGKGLFLPLHLMIDSAKIVDAALFKESASFRVNYMSLKAWAKGNHLEIEHIEMNTPYGRAELSGKARTRFPYPFSIDSQGIVANKNIPPVRFKASASGDLGKMILNALLTEPFEVRAQIKVQGLIEKPTWTASVDIIKADLKRIYQRLPRLDIKGRLEGAGDIESYSASASLDVDSDLPLKRVAANLQGSLNSLCLDRLVAILSHGEITATGDVTWKRGFFWNLEIEGNEISPSAFYEKAPAGEIDFEAETTGAWDGKKVKLQRLQFKALDTHFESKGTLGKSLDFVFKARSRDISKWMSGASGALYIQGEIKGTPSTPFFAFEVNALRLKFQETLIQAFNCNVEANLEKNGYIGGLLKAEKVVHGSSELNKVRASLQGSLADHEIELGGMAGKRPFSLKLAGKYSAGQWTGRVTYLEADASTFGQWSLEKTAMLKASLQGIETDPICLKSDLQSMLCASVFVDYPHKKWRLEANASTLPANLLNPFLDSDVLLSGKTNIDLYASGTGTIVNSGRASLTGIEATIVPLNIHLSKGNAKVFLQKDLGHFTVSAFSDNGTVEAKGTFDLSQLLKKKNEVEMRVKGKDFLAANLPEIMLSATPDLLIKWKNEGAVITGKVLVPKAEIDLEGIVPPQTLSEDVIIVDGSESETEGQARPFSAHLELELGEEVEIGGYGIRGWLKGKLHIVAQPGKVATATGELNLTKGTFSMYGQKLTIQQGRLIFASTPIDNPGIDIVAIREIKKDGVVAGIKATGTAWKPEITLFSQPQMDQASILSYLIIGRPLSMASKEEGGTLVEAAKMLALKQGASVIQTLSQRFGFLDVHLEEGKGEKNLAMVVGLYLTPRLYISYGRSLFKSASTFKLRFEIGRGWRIETAVEGENSGADLLYSPSK